MEGFQEQEDGEEGHKLGRKVIPRRDKRMMLSMAFDSNLISLEHGEGQTGLGDGVPNSFEKVFDFCCSQATKKDLFHQLASQVHKDKGLDVDDCHAVRREGWKLIRQK